MYICIYVYIPCLSALTHSPSHARSLPMQQTNMKYMDGTPYMKEFTPPPLTADHLPIYIYICIPIDRWIDR